jgi:hypothetical protein
MQVGVPGNTVALPSDLATGLEDFGVEDLKLPRLTVNHEAGTFKDMLSNMEYPELVVIPLGAIKQRVLWHPAINDDKKDVVPLCKSTDYQTGYPTLNQPVPTDNFPWPAVGWNPSDFQPNSEGRVVLPCSSCRLKEWGSHPLDGKKTWCTEQHSIPLLYGPPGSEPGMTALFTAQRSSINASKAFFASIMRRSLPAYAVRATLRLNAHQRGKNKYYVPVFIETGLTDQENWPVYSESLTSIRTFLTQPPRLKDEQNAVNAQQLGQSNVITGQVTQSGGNFGGGTWAPGQQQAPVQQYVQPQQPVQQQYVQSQQPVQQQQYVQPQQADPWPVQQPMQSAPVQQPIVQQLPPVAPPSVATPAASPVQQQPPVGSPTARDADDDLPF